jgi:hypothetical protein
MLRRGASGYYKNIDIKLILLSDLRLLLQQKAEQVEILKNTVRDYRVQRE